MVVIRGPFLGETKNGGGKDDADDEADDVAEECYEEISPLGVDFYKLCDVVLHLYAILFPNCGEEYPRPRQHDEDANQQVHIVGSGAKGFYSSHI